MSEKLVRWLIFSVVLALVPLAVNGVATATRGKALALDALISHGELLLITAALCAAAAGELFGTGPGRPIWKLLAGGFCLLILMFASIYFADVSAAHLSQLPVNSSVITNVSITLYVSGLISSGSCIVLSEV